MITPPKMKVRLFEALIGIPLALIGLWASPMLYRMVDPTAGSFDLGILQSIIFPVLAVMAFNSLAYIGSALHCRNYGTYESNIPTRFALHIVYLVSMVLLAMAL